MLQGLNHLEILAVVGHEYGDLVVSETELFAVNLVMLSRYLLSCTLRVYPNILSI